MSTVGVVVGTFGNRVQWSKVAQRAIASIHAQTCAPDDWIHVHGGSLADARNKGAEILEVDNYIFLDADDELSPRYVEEMRNAAVLSSNPDVIYRPATIGVYEDGTTDEKPVMIPLTDLKRANCIVIGAMCPAHLFFEVGGFQEWPMLEDWALWRAMVAKGASIRDAEHAVYRVHVRTHSRNTDQGLHRDVYRQIQKAMPL